jgi:protein gp37
MNRSDIEWTEFTSNPVRGACRHACFYCYAERIRKHYGQPAELSWHPEELAKIETRKKPAVIFMGSMHDLFGHWVPADWIERILDTAKRCPQHTFLFLTKNPSRYNYFEFTPNCWIGYTDDGIADLRNWVHFKGRKNRFVSFEPLIGENVSFHPDLIDAAIIGAMTGPKAIRPYLWQVQGIMRAMTGKPVFLKDNLLSLFPELPKRQDTAWELPA